MKQILIINDCTAEAEHAARFALNIAQKTRVDILLANTVANPKYHTVTVGGNDIEIQNTLLDELISAANKEADAFKPVINELDISKMNETQLAEFIHTKGIGLIVKGELDAACVPGLPHLNIQTVLNKVCCPVMLVPANWKATAITHIVYLADLRYCRAAVVNYLAELAKPFNADIAVAHFSAKNLPDMEQGYAEDVFDSNIRQRVHYESLFFNNTKERDLAKAVDVLINGMHDDLLVLVNHRYHFEELLGRYITDTLPPNITVPVMVFPY